MEEAMQSQFEIEVKITGILVNPCCIVLFVLLHLCMSRFLHPLNEASDTYRPGFYK